MSVFVHPEGIKTVLAGGWGGQKMAKFCPRSCWMPPYPLLATSLAVSDFLISKFGKKPVKGGMQRHSFAELLAVSIFKNDHICGFSIFVLTSNQRVSRILENSLFSSYSTGMARMRLYSHYNSIIWSMWTFDSWKWCNTIQKSYHLNFLRTWYSSNFNCH